MLYLDDCLNIMKTLPEMSVDMVYLDPPFYTQKTQRLSDKDGYEYVFSDVWDSKDDYLRYISLRLSHIKRLLKDTGSVFLHCDSTASHYLKLELDKVFGQENFRSEIIWTYKRWSNSKKGLLPAHQTIFFYSKTERYKFNTIYCDYSPTTNIDQIMQERERNSDGKAAYKRDNNGKIILYGEKKGVPISDVWEIPFLNPKAKERTGYPTQKPIELLDRIIQISTDIGDCVLDPFCGSGTTLVSAKLLQREYIGIDNNCDAIDLCNKRLNQPFKTNSALLEKGIGAYKTKTDKECAILCQFECDIVQRNKGIDAFLKKHYMNAPVAIKIQRDNESFSESVELLRSASEKKGCSFSILITRDMFDDKVSIPPNMILISRYEAQFESMIKQMLLKRA